MTHEGKSRSAMLKIEINTCTWYIHSVLLPAEVFYFPTSSGQGDDVYQNLIFAGVQKTI